MIRISVNKRLNIPLYTCLYVKFLSFKTFDMEFLNQTERRNYVGNFYRQYRHRGKPYTVKECSSILCERAIYNIIDKIENGISLERKRTGKTKWTPQEIKRLANSVKGKVGTLRGLARKHKLDHKTVKSYLKIHDITLRKRIKAPKVTEKQKVVQKKRLNKLRYLFAPTNGVDQIKDDESYFIVGEYKNDSYFHHESIKDPKARFKYLEKYPGQVLVWIAISARGKSRPFLFTRTNKFAVNKEVYSKKCIPKVKKFIDMKYRDGKYLFWPDLASAHYAKASLQKLDSLGIKYVPKESNPPNVPQLRKVETFWAHLKNKVYANNWTPKTGTQLINKIRKELKTFTPQYFQRLFAHSKTKIRSAADHGVQSLKK